MKIIVTGGAGFIGSAYVRKAASRGDTIMIIDKMTYASSREAIAEPLASGKVELAELDICDDARIAACIGSFEPDRIIHFAAESHVDNSIAAPNEFIQSNIVGTYSLLNAARAYWHSLDEDAQKRFRFHHISTDEVYGDLPHPDDLPAGEDAGLFKETTSYKPSSPYSASKAASDHLVHAWHRTYGLPVTISNCSNNYGPYQHVEKLLPKTINNALSCKQIPIYGTGRNIRDWLYVDDHIDAIDLILAKGRLGETYNVGGSCELTNIDLVTKVLTRLDDLCPIQENKHNVMKLKTYADLITYVEDRAGHDLRYAIDASKIESELGWRPAHTIDEGLNKMIVHFANTFSENRN